MELTGRVSLSRKLFFYIAVVFVLCVAIQVFFAGYAIFVDPVKWSTHVFFVKVIEFLPIIMLIISFMGKLPKILRWQSLGLFLLIFLMYATANIPAAGAFHPVVALLMFWLSIAVVKRAWRSAYKAESGTKENFVPEGL